MGLNAREPDFIACEQQRCRPACSHAQSDQRLRSSLSDTVEYIRRIQGSHRLEKYLNLEGFLEKSLKIKSALEIKYWKITQKP